MKNFQSTLVFFFIFKTMDLLCEPPCIQVYLELRKLSHLKGNTSLSIIHGIGANPKLNENDSMTNNMKGVQHNDLSPEFSFNKDHTDNPKVLAAHPAIEARVRYLLPTYLTDTVHTITPKKPIHEIITCKKTTK